MAEFTGILCPDDITTVYSRTAIQKGTRAFDNDGNEYIFLEGVASTVAYSWVTYSSYNEFKTALLAANALGPVAIAQAAIVAGKYGWYMIWGSGWGCSTVDASEALADNATIIGRTGADGYVGTNPEAGDVIYGAITRSSVAGGGDDTRTLFQIYYPYVNDETAGH